MLSNPNFVEIIQARGLETQLIGEQAHCILPFFDPNVDYSRLAIEGQNVFGKLAYQFQKTSAKYMYKLNRFVEPSFQ